MHKSKVLITGGTGFIGSHIVRCFCENNISVTCLIRKDSVTDNLKGLPVQFVTGDVKDESSLKEAFKGQDCVIHNASKVFDWGEYKDFYDTNVCGTLNVLNACKENDIRQVIMTASVSVYGEENCLKEKDENSPMNSHYKYFADKFFPCKLNYYRDTKTLAKKSAIEFARESKMNLTILEPVWVYGEREVNTGFYEYMKTAKSGIPFLPGSLKNKFHVIYAQDLAKAYHLAFIKQLEGVQSFIIGNRKAENMSEIYGLFLKEANIKKPRNIPKTLIYPIAFSLELLYTLLNIKTPPTLTRGRVNMFYDNIEYSTEKAEKMLGFTNQYSLEEGIKKTVEWYKEQKLI